MKKRVFLTSHSKDRFVQRTKISESEYQQLANTAFNNGYNETDFDNRLSDFFAGINHQNGKYLAKIYNNLVFIFNNCHGNRLLTVYPFPKELGNVEDYLIPKETLERCALILTDKETGEYFYLTEGGDLTKDLDELLEFTDQKKANNYIKNNNKLAKYLDKYNIEIF